MPKPPTNFTKYALSRKVEPVQRSQEETLRLLYRQVEGCMGALLALQDRIRTLRTELLELLPSPEGDDIPF